MIKIFILPSISIFLLLGCQQNAPTNLLSEFEMKEKCASYLERAEGLQKDVSEDDGHTWFKTHLMGIFYSKSKETCVAKYYNENGSMDRGVEAYGSFYDLLASKWLETNAKTLDYEKSLELI